MNYYRKSVVEQQLQSSTPLQSHSNAGSQMLGQTQQSLQQIGGSVQQQLPNAKLDETRTAGLLDDGLSSPGQDKIAAERERQRQREQERRRREAVSNFFFNIQGVWSPKRQQSVSHFFLA